MEIQMQHYAFLVSEKEFDQIFGRIKARKLKYWADPEQKEEGKINNYFGGRGVYFEDLSGHLLEIITKPYGDWPGCAPAKADSPIGTSDHMTERNIVRLA